MSTSSIEFLLALFAVSAVFFYLPGRRWRLGLFALCNAGTLYLLLPDLAHLITLALWLVSGYAVARGLAARPSRWVLAGYIVALFAAFVVLKRYAFLTVVLPAWVLDHPIALIGLSYMLFRQIHFVVDSMQNQIRRPSLWVYLNYQLNLFAIVSGPIQRYQEFEQYWDRPEPILANPHDLLRAYLRVLVGIVKVTVIAAACLSQYQRLAGPFDRLSVGELAGGWKAALCMFYLFPAYVYFNFAGYCDIVIGGASLIGLKMPENFNRPYRARNMIDFWQRWHRTLSSWIRDYLFTPMYKAIALRWPTRASSLAFLCFFIALFLAGVWHGSTSNFVLFGLIHGFGVSAAKLWENILIKRYGRSGLREYMQSRTIHAAAVVANLHFVCVSFLFFPEQWRRGVKILASFTQMA